MSGAKKVIQLLREYESRNVIFFEPDGSCRSVEWKELYDSEMIRQTTNQEEE